MSARAFVVRAGFLFVIICCRVCLSGEDGTGGFDMTPSISADFTVNSKYVWRGINTTDEPVFQPGFTGAIGSLSFNTWGNLDLTDVNENDGDFNEIDLTLDYAFSFKMMDFDIGVIHYLFPNSGVRATTEIFGTATANVLLSPSIGIYQDVDEADGTYINIAISHSFEDLWKATEEMSLSVDLGLGVSFASDSHNDFYYGVDQTAFTDCLFSLGVPITINKYWTIKPGMNISTLLDSDIRDVMEYDTNVWGGITASFAL